MLHGPVFVAIVFIVNVLAAYYGIRNVNSGKIKRSHSIIGSAIMVIGTTLLLKWASIKIDTSTFTITSIDALLMIGICLNVIGLSTIHNYLITKSLLLKIELGYLACGIIAAGLALGQTASEKMIKDLGTEKSYSESAVTGAYQTLMTMRRDCQESRSCRDIAAAEAEIGFAAFVIGNDSVADYTDDVPSFENYKKLLTNWNGTHFTPWNPMKTFLDIKHSINKSKHVRDYFYLLLGVALSLRIVKTIDELYLHPK